MSATVLQLTVDCRQPGRLVEFWQPLLGYEVPPPPAPHDTWRDYYLSLGDAPETIDGDGRDRLRPPGGQNGIQIWFQTVPEPKTSKNRLHLDLRVSDGRKMSKSERRAAIESAVCDIAERGGQLVAWYDDQGNDHVHATVQDPEGNEFCVV